MNIFEETIRPEEALFYSRKDPNDPQMGDVVEKDHSGYEKAEVVILGCPQDEGVRRNKGRPGAAKGPDAIRKALYKFSATEPLRSKNIFDLGNTRIAPTLEATHARQERVVYQILNDGKKVISLGGGNDISYPDCSALSRIADKLLVFNIDSHFDVRADRPRNSGTPYRQVLEEERIQPRQLYQIANKPFANSPEYQQYLERVGANIYPLESLRRQGVKTVIQKILDENSADAIFWGFDLDAVQTTDAPGVSATYPVGLTAEEICRIAQLAGADRRSRVSEISEMNPLYDIDGRTAKLAAMMILYFLSS